MGTKPTRRVAAACLIALLPSFAHAADGLYLAQSRQPGTIAVGEGALVTVAGVILGAGLGYVFLPIQGATIIGGLAGGFVSNWWYQTQLDQYLALPR